MNSNFVRPPKSGNFPSNLLKLRSLQEYNNTDVRITEKNVYNCKAKYRKSYKTPTTKKHVSQKNLITGFINNLRISMDVSWQLKGVA
jgi:hypothetical protein